MYNAHIREDGVAQSVADHLKGTAQLAGKFAAAFGEAKRGELLGMAHDIGKNSQEFQNRLHGGPKVDHATAGAVECAKINEMLASCCVLGHHGGLPNYGNPDDRPGDPTCIGRLRKGILGKIPAYHWDGRLEPGTPMPQFRDGFGRSLWVRMLYSCLVDGDYLDTEAFMKQTVRPKYDSLATLLQRLSAYIAPWFPAKTPLNACRCQILEQCMAAASAPRGVFTLTVPTGGGKTVASLAFALRHAVEQGLERVIYVIPYTSIIEQNARVFREILGDENVLEHHSAAQWDVDEEVSEKNLAQRLAAENWDAPLVVTTAVQFFESLYSNLPSKCRKLHNIANSVVIFDEAQMIPGSQLKPCVGAIAELVAHFRATAVLCTATQPVLEDILRDFCPELSVTELCPQTAQLYEKLRRVAYRNGGTLTNEALAEMLAAENQVLCIVNTRKMAQDVFALLPPEGSFHLSTLMCPRHRTQVLDEIRRRLAEGLPCRVVSTSLIEAGVDVDFPAVYRQMTGLDSLVQAAGRCNREGKRSAEESIVTYFEGEQPAPPLQKMNIDAAREVLARGSTPGDAETIAAYFRSWRSHIGENLDIKDTVGHLKNGISGCLLPFKTVAENFRMIDDNTKTVYIPMEEGEQLCRRIADGMADRRDYRQAGQYAVNLYETHFQALVQAGDVELLDGGSGLLRNMRLYDPQQGLSLKAEFGKAIFS